MTVIKIILLLLSFFPSTIYSAESERIDKTLRVGIYSDRGVGFTPGREREYAEMLISIIKTMIPDSKTGLVSSGDIRSGLLESKDVVIFPGGSGRGQSKSLGKAGRELVKKFVKRGGGFVGICAGAYIGQMYNFRSSSYGLGIANASLYKRGRNWNRGAGIIRISLTKRGRFLFPELKEQKYVYMHFNNGPLLIKGNKQGMRSYNELMKIESDIFHDRPAGRGESMGKTFLLKTLFGEGTVVLVSGHPEATPGYRWILARMVQLAGKGGVARFPHRFVRPGKYSREIMFDKIWKKNEHNYLKIAAGRQGLDSRKRVESLEKLKGMGSRNISGLFKKLLSGRDVYLRKAASDMVIFYDYFPVKSYIKDKLVHEKDSTSRATLQRSIKYLGSD